MAALQGTALLVKLKRSDIGVGIRIDIEPQPASCAQAHCIMLYHCQSVYLQLGVLTAVLCMLLCQGEDGGKHVADAICPAIERWISILSSVLLKLLSCLDFVFFKWQRVSTNRS